MFHSRSIKITALVFSAFMLMACSLFNATPTPVATLVFATLTPASQAEQAPAATPTQAPSETPVPPTVPSTWRDQSPRSAPPRCRLHLTTSARIHGSSLPRPLCIASPLLPIRPHPRRGRCR